MRAGDEFGGTGQGVGEERGPFVLGEVRGEGSEPGLQYQPEPRTDPQHVAHQQRERVVLSPEPTYADLQARAGEPIRIPLEPTYRELQARSHLELVGWWQRWMDRAGRANRRQSPTGSLRGVRYGPAGDGDPRDDPGDPGGADGDDGGDGLVPP